MRGTQNLFRMRQVRRSRALLGFDDLGWDLAVPGITFEIHFVKASCCACGGGAGDLDWTAIPAETYQMHRAVAHESAVREVD